VTRGSTISRKNSVIKVIFYMPFGKIDFKPE